MVIVSKQLAKYIEQSVRQGYTDPQIKAQLLSAGYAQSDIDTAFRHVRKTTFPVRESLAVAAGLLVVLILIASFLMFTDRPREIEQVTLPVEEELGPLAEPAPLAETGGPALPGSDALQPPESGAEQDARQAQNTSGLYDSSGPQLRAVLDGEPGQSCPSVEDARVRDNCFSQLARRQGSSGLCRQVGDAGLRDACYSYFIVRGDEPCDRFTSKSLRSACEQRSPSYSQVSLTLESGVETCQSISDAAVREACQAALDST